MLERSKALQIYFKPGLKEDDVMLRVWQAAKRNARAQEIFRDMLREGLVALVANGTMPESIIEECGLDAIVERRRRRTAKHSDRQAATPAPAHPAPPYAYPGYPAYPAPAQYPPQEFPAYAYPTEQAPVGRPASDHQPPQAPAQPAVQDRAQEIHGASQVPEPPRATVADSSPKPSQPPVEGTKSGKKLAGLM